MASPEDVTVAEKKKIIAININDLAKNIDVDGDGTIDDEERRILNTLKTMDIDGDGEISLKELVNLGKQLNISKNQAETFKRMVYAVIVFAFIAILATFLACLAAVEAAKDSKPDTSGVMKTVVTGGNPKVVQVEKHVEKIALTELYKASYETLRGVSDLGFQVGSKFYQYTITGFEMEYREAPLSPWVRFYSSRKDTIYIDSTKAAIEFTTGAGELDISKASMLNRHLLAAMGSDAGRSLLQELSQGGSATTEVSGGSSVDDDTVNAIAQAATAANITSPTTGAMAAYAAMPCPKYAEKDTEVSYPSCDCNDGFVGDITPSINGWMGECKATEQQPHTSCWYDPEDNEVDCECNMGFKGTVEFDEEVDDEWFSTCTPVPVPPHSKIVSDTHPNSMIPSLSYTYSWPQCDQDYKGMLWWDHEAQEWAGEPCVEVMCPIDVSKKVVASDGSIHCKCTGKYAGNGYRIMDGNVLDYGGCWEIQCPYGSTTASVDPVNSTCTCGKQGFFPATLKVNETSRRDWSFPMFTCAAGTCCDNEDKCDSSKEEFLDQCVWMPCPANSHASWDPPDYERSCKCDDGFVGGITWSPADKKFAGACKPFTCKAGFTEQETAGVRTCVAVTCPDEVPHVTKPDGSVSCGCPMGTKGNVNWERTSPSTGYWMSMCAQEECPDVVYSSIDPSTYKAVTDYSHYPARCTCPIPTGRTVLGAINWEHPRVNATDGFMGTPDTSVPKTWVPHCVLMP